MSSAVIAGVGAVTSIGNNADEMWRNARQAHTGLALYEEHDSFAGLIKEASEKDRLYKLAKASLDECIADAAWTAPFDERTALIFASGSPDGVHIATAADRYDTRGRCRPDTVYKMMHSYVPARLGGELNIQGPVYTMSAACAGSSHAIHLAHTLLASNTVDRVLCGGGEVLDRYTLAAFVAMRSVISMRRDLGEQLIQPFGADRSGIALGEGCGWLALTRADLLPPADSRVAVTDSSVINVPEATYGDVVELSEWSRLIGQSAEEPCDLVMAHATSTPKGDLAEGKAILHHFPDTPVRSTKYLFGHTLSASTVLDVIMLRQSMLDGEILTMGHEYPLDPELAALNISGSPMNVPVNRAIKFSAAFGGAMGKLILEKV